MMPWEQAAFPAHTLRGVRGMPLLQHICQLPVVLSTSKLCPRLPSKRLAMIHLSTYPKIVALGRLRHLSKRNQHFQKSSEEVSNGKLLIYSLCRAAVEGAAVCVCLSVYLCIRLRAQTCVPGSNQKRESLSCTLRAQGKINSAAYCKESVIED